MPEGLMLESYGDSFRQGCPVIHFYPQELYAMGVEVVRYEHCAIPAGTIFLKRLQTKLIYRTINSTDVLGFQISQRDTDLFQITLIYLWKGRIVGHVVANFRHGLLTEEGRVELYELIAQLNSHYSSQSTSPGLNPGNSTEQPSTAAPIRSLAEAYRVLNEFPADTLEAVVTLVELAREDLDRATQIGPPELPDGWEGYLSGGCFYAKYQEGLSDRETRYVPMIYIPFHDIDAQEPIRVQKSVITRLGPGICSCGQRMPIVQACIWARHLQLSKRSLSVLVGHLAESMVCLWARVSPASLHALKTRRHYGCS